MTVILYGLKNCDTCTKAIKTLEENGQDVAFVDIREEADLPTKLPEWIEAIGADAIINKRSTTWRNLSPMEKEIDAMPLLGLHPTLIKRPVIETEAGTFVGWDKTTKAAVL